MGKQRLWVVSGLNSRKIQCISKYHSKSRLYTVLHESSPVQTIWTHAIHNKNDWYYIKYSFSSKNNLNLALNSNNNIISICLTVSEEINLSMFKQWIQFYVWQNNLKYHKKMHQSQTKFTHIQKPSPPYEKTKGCWSKKLSGKRGIYIKIPHEKEGYIKTSHNKDPHVIYSILKLGKGRLWL